MKGGSVMQKSFYIVVPFAIGERESIGSKIKKTPKIKLTEQAFQRAKNQLMQRVEFIVLGLRSCSLESIPLNTLEIAELLWSVYHPSEAERGYYPEMPSELLD